MRTGPPAPRRGALGLVLGLCLCGLQSFLSYTFLLAEFSLGSPPRTLLSRRGARSPHLGDPPLSARGLVSPSRGIRPVLHPPHVRNLEMGPEHHWAAADSTSVSPSKRDPGSLPGRRESSQDGISSCAEGPGAAPDAGRGRLGSRRDLFIFRFSILKAMYRVPDHEVTLRREMI